MWEARLGVALTLVRRGSMTIVMKPSDKVVGVECTSSERLYLEVKHWQIESNRKEAKRKS